jgi:hypothetical protein
MVEEQGEEVSGLEDRNRSGFLWNQQRYILENIKLADTKAGFVLTISAALMTSSLSPAGHLAVRWAQGGTSLGLLVEVADRLGLVLLAAAVLMSVWTIAPRLRSHNSASPVSWVNVAQYADAGGFRVANQAMSAEMAADYLCEQVFYMSRICVRKHRLVTQALVLAVAGAGCIAVALIAQ